MKKLRVLFFSSVIFCSLNPFVDAQINEIDFIKGGVDDAQKLFQGYLEPYGNIFGANLNAGWYNTAKVHKLGGFDVTVTLNTAFAPPSARTFDLSKLELDADIVGDNFAPTVAGKRTETRPELVYNEQFDGNTVELARYTVPNGTGVSMIPLPMGQVGIGLPFGTEVTVRYLPTLYFGDYGNVGLWGVGGKHSIIQHIPGLKHLPIIDITAQGGYTKLRTFANINFGADQYNPANMADIESQLSQLFLDQKIELTASAWTVNLIASQTLPVISFYQGIGYSNSTVELALNGNYPLPSIGAMGEPYEGEVIVDPETGIVKDPLSFEMKNNKDLRLNAGLRLKLGVLTIQFDYTKANYSVFTAGLGISFR